ncbi:MAG: beta-ketoacyl-[acyl-carrier-protein] synthase family protein [Armatimonadetes bacterium]|nr:beta-ketoacyl-[acyl-carrier-protein] synthase family protein [Armatimonadota bacterium]
MAGNQRVVVTGIGAVCCLGLSVPEFWEGLCAGRSGIGPIARFDTTGLRNPCAGEIKHPEALRLPAGADPEDLAVRFALAAAREAVADAALPQGGDPGRRGIVFSTNFGGAHAWERFATAWHTDPAQVRSADLLRFSFEDAVAIAATALRFLGPRGTLSLSCSSGAASVAWAMDTIRAGRADVMLAGGHDALSLSSLAGLSALRTVTAEQIRPFDKNRSGTLFGEGAGMLVVEARDHAVARGARIYGEVCGAAVNNNAYHVTAPDKQGEGLAAALRAALGDAEVPPEAVDYVNAHATGTKYHDAVETAAIKAVLGARAGEIPVSSIKAATAHPMAAAGSLEAIASLLALRDGIVPPTLNYETPDPACDLDCVPNIARRTSLRCVVSLSSGIGGNNAALVLRKDEP